jgi:hypothetical protein
MKLDFEQRQRSGKLADEMAFADDFSIYADELIGLRDTLKLFVAKPPFMGSFDEQNVSSFPVKKLDMRIHGRTLIVRLVDAWNATDTTLKSKLCDQYPKLHDVLADLVEAAE